MTKALFFDIDGTLVSFETHRIPWIVFDRDQVQGFDEIIAEAVSKGIQVGWSNVSQGCSRKIFELCYANKCFSKVCRVNW